MLEEIKSSLEVSMDKTVDSLKYQLTKIRTGRASANVLDGILVDYYGVPTPVNQVGQVSHLKRVYYKFSLLIKL